MAYRVYKTYPSMFADNWDYVASFERMEDAKRFAEASMMDTGNDYYVRNEADTENVYSAINW